MMTCRLPISASLRSIIARASSPREMVTEIGSSAEPAMTCLGLPSKRSQNFFRGNHIAIGSLQQHHLRNRAQAASWVLHNFAARKGGSLHFVGLDKRVASRPPAFRVRYLSGFEDHYMAPY